MKKTKTTSKLYIPFVVMIFIALVCLIVALCLCDYDFNKPLTDVFQSNMTSFILCGVSVALDVALIAAAIVLRVKNDELSRGDVALAFQIVIVLLLEAVLCVPIFIVWVIEKIHDAVSNAKRENI